MILRRKYFTQLFKSKNLHLYSTSHPSFTLAAFLQVLKVFYKCFPSLCFSFWSCSTRALTPFPDIRRCIYETFHSSSCNFPSSQIKMYRHRIIEMKNSEKRDKLTYFRQDIRQVFVGFFISSWMLYNGYIIQFLTWYTKLSNECYWMNEWMNMKSCYNQNDVYFSGTKVLIWNKTIIERI